MRGLKSSSDQKSHLSNCSRIAHAVRGLKFHRADTTPCRGWSHRSRGAWIEICKYNVWKYDRRCRIAHAVRGLKWIEPAQDPFQNMSHRSRGAWIEIS